MPNESILLRNTLRRLKRRPRTLTYKKIAEDLELSVSWLEQLVGGKIDDPGVRRIEALYNYLKADA